MRLKFWHFFLILSVLVWFGSCAKEPKITVMERPRKIKIKDDPVALSYLEFIRSELGRYEEKPEESLKSINEVIATNPDVGYFYYQRALIEAGLGQWGDVVDDCKVALAKDPKNLDAKILLARSLGVLKKHNDAIRYLLEVRRADPGLEATYPLLAKEYMNIKKYREAERVMRGLLARDSEAMIAYYYLGAIYGAYLGQPARAIEIYKRILEREPENFQVIDAISMLYLEMGRPRKALEMLLDLEKQRVHDISLKLKIAQIYYKLKEYPPAIERFKVILEKNPDSDKIMYYLGVLYEELGNYPDAMSMYEKVPPVSGLYKDARLRLAYRYKAMGDIEASKNVLLEAVRKQPKIPEFYQYLGGVLEREGDYKGAVKLLNRASRFFPDNEGLYFSLGTLYERMKDYKKAMEMMRKVLKVNPKNASALNYIGYTILETGGNMAEAEDMLQEAFHLKPNDGYIVDSLGWLYFKKGDYTRAFHLLKQAIKLVPNEPTILKHMGEVYLQRGEKNEALKYFKKALELWQKKERVDEKEIEDIISIVEKATGGNR